MFLGICIAFVLWSCTPIIYYPNAPNIPLPGNKNELKAGVGIGLTSKYFEGSYAIDSHLVVLANYYGTDLKRNYFGEIGSGYYYSDYNGFKYDLVGGLGIGKVSDNIFNDEVSWSGKTDKYHYKLNNDYKRIMIQGDMGFFYKYLESGFSVKAYSIYMGNTHYELDTLYSYSKSWVSHYTYIPFQSYFFEPALFLNIGFKHVKLHLCAGVSLPFGNSAPFWNRTNLNLDAFESGGIFIDLFQK